MANILYLDDDDVAYTVIANFLNRSGHEITVAKTMEQAEGLIAKGLFYDLVIIEPKLESGDASGFVSQLKSNPYLIKLPVVVYTKNKKKEAAKKLTDLDVQNYLMKPYKENVLKDEIDKAMEHDWRIQLSGDPESFYTKANEADAEYFQVNKQLSDRMSDINGRIAAMSAAEDVLEVDQEIQLVIQTAEKAGFTFYQNMLSGILKSAEEMLWGDIQPLLPHFQYAELIQEYRLAVLQLYFEEETPVADDSEDNADADADAEVTQISDSGIAENTSSDAEPGALVSAFSSMQIEERLNEVTEYPVVESAAATFTMIVNDEDTSLEEIVNLVGQDSGLATAVLKFSNSPVVAASTPSEDIERAVAVIGIKRVRTLATSLRTISEVAPLFTAFKWQNFWMHQVGCAMLSEYIFKQLNLPGRSDIAYLGGLIHDIGKIILCEIDPEGYSKVVESAQERKISLPTAEKEYFSTNFCEAGSRFAELGELPEVLKTVMAHSQNPGEASDYADVIGTVSIADYLCMKYQVGDNGNRYIHSYSSISNHPSWEILARWIPPSFNTVKFLRGIEEQIFKLKSDLVGIIEAKD